MKEERAELGFAVDVSETLAERGINTAERLKARKPELVEACVRMLARGIGPKVCAEVLAIDVRAVLAIGREAEAEGRITPHKERTAAQLRSIITLGLDALVDKAAAGKLSMLDLAVAVDKEQLLSGGATSRVEVTESAEVAELRRMLAARPVGMGTGAQEVAQKAPGAARAPLVIDAETAPSDSQSPVNDA